MAPTTLGHYALGLSGLALLRRWMQRGDETDEAYAQLIELAAAAQSNDLMQIELGTRELPIVEGYTKWSETYDGPNPLIDSEEALCNPMLAAIAEGEAGRRALDAGCGTGRKARTLVELLAAGGRGQVIKFGRLLGAAVKAGGDGGRHCERWGIAE